MPNKRIEDIIEMYRGERVDIAYLITDEDAIFESFLKIFSEKPGFLLPWESWSYFFIPAKERERQKVFKMLAVYIYLKSMYSKINEIKKINLYESFEKEVIDKNKYNILEIYDVLSKNKDVNKDLDIITLMLNKIYIHDNNFYLYNLITFILKDYIGSNFTSIKLLAPNHYYKNNLDKIKNIQRKSFNDKSFDLFISDIELEKHFKKTNLPKTNLSFEDLVKDLKKIWINSNDDKKIDIFTILIGIIRISNDIESRSNFYHFYIDYQNVWNKAGYSDNDKYSVKFNIYPAKDISKLLNKYFNVVEFLLKVNNIESLLKEEKKVNLKIKWDKNSLDFYINNQKLEKDKFLWELTGQNINWLEEDLRKNIIIDNEAFKEIREIKRQKEIKIITKLGEKSIYNYIDENGYIHLDGKEIIENRLASKILKSDNIKDTFLKETKEYISFIEKGIGIDSNELLSQKRLYNVDLLILMLINVKYKIEDVELIYLPLRLKNIIINMIEDYNILK